MKLKKRIIWILLLSLVIATSSCRYEEGPYVSFTSPETRLVGYWKLSKVELNGTEVETTSNQSALPGNYFAFFIERMLSVTTVKDGVILESVSGYWEFQNHEKELIINFVLANKEYSYIATIKRLTKKELVYEYVDQYGDTWKLTFDSRSNLYY